MTYYLRILTCFFLFGAAFWSPAIQAEEASSDPVHVELIYEEDSIQPGRPFWAAVRLSLKDKWHAYWKNPGDAGMAPSIEWTLPEGYHAGPIHWPTPERFVTDDAVVFGYHTEAVFLTEITPSDHLSDKSTIQANIQWVVCSDETCLPGESDVTATIPVSSNTPKPLSKWAKIFAQTRELEPTQHAKVTVHRKNQLLELTVNHNNPLTHAYFCPEHMDMVDSRIEAVVMQHPDRKDEYRIVLKDSEAHQNNTLKGVLVLLDGNSPHRVVGALDVDVPITNLSASDAPELISMANEAKLDEASVAAISPEFEGGLGFALILAFVGGMILNLMPCVLPVISFKVLSFVKLAGEKRSLIFKHGLAFSIGVLISFWALAGVMLILQAYGRTVGWGFQLQEPIFVATLAAFILVFALSLFGVFEVGAIFASWAGTRSQKKSEGISGSFFSGILATAVATPCTGPFLGSAIGFAVTLPAFYALMIFTTLGLGMAFPYLLLAAFPSLLRFLPKPGNWMITFKEIMGFIMLATVLWLMWVFAAQTNSLATIVLLVSFFFFSIGCWIYGRWGTPVKKRLTRLISYAFTLSTFVFASYILYSSSTHWVVAYDEWDHVHPEGDHITNAEVWEKFSPERIAELRSQGKPILVDFTAKWCLICQANHLVLSTNNVQGRLEELGVVKMKADWTKSDPVITEELRKFGRNGVPLYLLYGPDPSQPPEVLPQVLTPDIVIDYLDQLEMKLAAREK